jgi:TonB family protein
MPRKEKLGRFVLLEEVEPASFGIYYRAAKLSATGLERLVSLLRLRPALSAHPDTASRLLDQVKFAAQMQSATAVKVFGIGKVEGSYYVSQELVEGKSLRAIQARCRQEAFPFAIDHALLIASKVCSVLEVAHARKDAQGARYFHGFLNPGSVLVSYEGDVRVRGFGLWPGRVREVTPPDAEESQYLAPEQQREPGAPRSDLFAAGAILFETLTGQPLAQDGGDLEARLGRARLLAPAEEGESGLPKPIADILRRSLAASPDARFADAAEMRKALDAILFSGDFAPTTFNLAFFLHSLFRQDIDREEKQLKQEREASYQEYLESPAPAPPSAEPAAPSAVPRPAEPLESPRPWAPVPAAPMAASEAAAPAPVPAGPRPVPPPPARDASVSRPPAELTFQAGRPASRAPIAAIAIVVVAGAAAAGGWYFMARRPAARPAASPPPTLGTPPPEAAAALARVKELEEKLRTLEAERAAAGTKAADDARRKLEKQAAAKGQTVDPAALAKAQDEARRKAQAEQERRIQDEKRRLEDEEKKAQQARLAEQNRAAQEAAAQAAAAAAPPTTVPPTTVPPPTTVAAATPPPAPAAPAAAGTKPGALVSLTDPGVIAPVVEKTPPLQYPPIALRQRVEGTVEVSVLVDEKGQVIEAKLVTAAGGRVGLNEAALDNARKRRYRPATKDGVPVRVWVPVRVKFELPR